MELKFEKKLINILKKDLRFIDDKDDSLIKNKIINSALKLDKELIGLLIKDKEIREHFFEKIDIYLVFNINKFIDYVSDKNFLSNSYTKFKNRIGLTIDNKYLGERGEVSLVWPFKDCVLEAGMDKEDQKNRNEIFFNEILAKDEIDKLFDKKVLTNFKKYTSKGEKEVKDFTRDSNGTIKDNLIIKGNNLLALHSLKDEFAGKIKLIYIDPPYYFKNKNNDVFAYNSSFKLSTWLTFMKNRLEVANELLNNDGIIFIQINDEGHAYLKLLMDEIFRDNFVNSITVKMSDLSGPKMSHLDKKFPKLKENILIYKKNNIKLNKITELKSSWDNEYKNYLENFDEDNYNYIKNFNFDENSLEELNKKLSNVKIISLSEKTKNLDTKDLNKKDKEKFIFDFCVENSYRIARTSNSFSIKKILDEIVDNYNQKVIAIKSPSNNIALCITTYDKSSEDPRVQIVFSKDTLEVPLGDLWLDINTSGLHTEGGIKFENGKKPEKLLNYIIKSSTKKGDIVLDYHLGGGTTCAVAHKIKRQYIGIEQLNYEENDSIVRLKNVISGDTTGISKNIDWNGGGEFISCELMKYNEEAIEKIKDAKDTKTLFDIWDEMCSHYFLNYNVEIKSFNENKKDFEKKELQEQKEVLCNMLNKNQLYVNLSEINDVQYNISNEDKKLNKKFYGES